MEELTFTKLWDTPIEAAIKSIRRLHKNIEEVSTDKDNLKTISFVIDSCIELLEIQKTYEILYTEMKRLEADNKSKVNG